MAARLPVLIAGGGIGGLTAAIALERAGIPVRVYEQAPALDEVGAGVSLWPNAVRALDRLGLAGPVVRDHQAMARIVIRRWDDVPLLRITQPGRYPEPAVCVHRSHLQKTLAGATHADTLVLGRRVTAVHCDDDGVDVRFHDGCSARGSLLIGCDGIRSAVRASLDGRREPHGRGYDIWRGVSSFELPPDLLGQSTEWWGAGRRFGILPGPPGTVFWYATRTRPPGGGNQEQARESGPPARLFVGWPPPVSALMATAAPPGPVLTLAEDLSEARAWGRGPVTLLGDAAHAMTPNMGQGACTAIEDAVVLARCLAAAGPVPVALRRYERLRIARTRWIVRRSRRIGYLGQVTGPWLVAARDRLMQWTPEAALRPSLHRVYGYSLDEVRP
jgi:2-polyprenyl-6-methoxyphenol hydroxylase-like FAD-dependent oxidoreductase